MERISRRTCIDRLRDVLRCKPSSYKRNGSLSTRQDKSLFREFRLASRPPSFVVVAISELSAPTHLALDNMAGLQTDDAVIGGLAHATKDEYEYEKKHVGADSDIADSLHHTDGPSPDGAHPTEEERIQLRRVPDSIPWAAYLIAFIELAERFSYYGSTVVFTNFIQQKLPAGSHTGAGGKNGQSGALGMGQRAATGLTTFNSFWVYVTPLLGAYIADTYWGRYKTICVAVAIALFGHVLLIISAVPGVIEHAHGAVACFAIAIVIMGLGTGAFKSNISPLIAEQAKGKRLSVHTLKTGERVILDPTLTVSRIYMVSHLFLSQS